MKPTRSQKEVKESGKEKIEKGREKLIDQNAIVKTNRPI
jgi:hypothetical protein